MFSNTWIYTRIPFSLAFLVTKGLIQVFGLASESLELLISLGHCLFEAISRLDSKQEC